MKYLILIIIFLIGFIYSISIISEHPGVLIINYGTYSIQLSLLFGIFLVTMIFIAFYLIIQILSSFTKFKKIFQGKNKE